MKYLQMSLLALIANYLTTLVWLDRITHLLYRPFSVTFPYLVDPVDN